MPRYDYRCESCKTEFELVQSFAEAGKGICPECSGAGQRVFHAVPVIYKGSGFYTTDYGRPKPPVESKNGSSDSSSSTSTSESKSDATTKPSSDSSDSSTSSSSKKSSDSGSAPASPSTPASSS
ncbi:MAG: FmdB family transcriptional regulator [Chloroflexi bacterium]|nr:FmdB family transcriptional regulator [Chloroflexota bacterium]MDA1271495.1 FmdB family transcriptional regulator [Chloroflexota bacterium]PKB58598.1 MAG: hypothetical protein BZY83_05960 [SAR202 cluster bacterium Casp-Chloro-G2]